MFKSIKRYLKSTSGNTLAEFAVTTAMMATLATTAAPKFSGVGEGAKEKKTLADIDKIVKSANNFYNSMVTEEGRGRFPGQAKYDEAVGSAPAISEDNVAEGLNTFIDENLSLIDNYENSGLGQFVYVFSEDPVSDDEALAGGWTSPQTAVDYNQLGAEDFKLLFGESGMESPFQDGAYIYLVIPGFGSGTNAQAPALVVADAENPTQLHKTLIP